MLKTILIACGTGMVSSAIINSALQDLLHRNRIQAKVILCRYSQMKCYLPQADLVIASVTPPEPLNRPVILGNGFLTGVGVDQLERDILAQLVDDRTASTHCPQPERATSKTTV